MQLTTHDTLDDPRLDLWHLYERAFAELRTKAVQRHLMTKEEFTDVLGDVRIVKLLVADDAGQLGAMATITNELDAVPLIAPEYFEAHWPDLYAEKRIWYVSFVAVDPAHQNAGAMATLIGEMVARLRGEQGLICVDICRHREQVSRLSEVIERQGGRVRPEIERVRLDTQEFWGYAFPAGRATGSRR